MSERQQIIGYNRTVKLKWLNETLDFFLAGMSETEIHETLRDRLKDELSVGREPKRGSREKTITLLLKTWVRVPVSVRELRDDAIHLLRVTPRRERLPFHWGMSMAVYPFWRTVADITGRLFRLQTTVVPLQVQRRAKELFGEREVVARSTRYVLRAFADWGVIDDSRQKGEYSPSAVVRIEPRVAVWLLESSVLSMGKTSVDFNGLTKSPFLYPFQMDRVLPNQLIESGRLEIIRHGLDSTLVRVRPSQRPLCKTKIAN